MTEEPKPARYGVKTAGRRHRLSQQSRSSTRKNTGASGWLREHASLWPLVVAAAAASGWLLTAAYAYGLGIPVSALDGDVADHIVVSTTVLAVWVGAFIPVYLIRRMRDRSMLTALAGGVYATISSTLVATTIPYALTIGGTFAVSRLILMSSRFASIRRAVGAKEERIMGGVSSRAVAIALPVLLVGASVTVMYWAGEKANGGTAAIPVALQPSLGSVTGELDGAECVGRLAPRVFVQLVEGDLRLVLYAEPPQRFVVTDCKIKP